MAATMLGEIGWSLNVDKNSHRTYKVDWLIETNDSDDGPAVVFGTAGLPGIGSTWTIGNDNDPWAFRTPESSITPYAAKKGDPGRHWKLTQTFTTNVSASRCNTSSFDNPISEPAKLSGSFAKYLREAIKDKDGKALKNTAFERFKGKLVEVTDPRPTVGIELNFLTLPLVTYSEYMKTTSNDATLWGLPKNTVSLTDCTWTQKWYGTCTTYYTVKYEFEVNFDGWEISLLNESTKKLRTGGDKDEPSDYIAVTDRLDNRSSGKTVLGLDGNPIGKGDADVYLDFQLHKELNYLLLGIPSSL